MIHLQDEGPSLEDRIWRLEMLHAYPDLSDIVIRYYRQGPEESEVKRIEHIYLHFRYKWYGRDRSIVKMSCKRSVGLFLRGGYA